MYNMITIKRVKSHYEVYVDNEFYSSCDTMSEVQEEIKEALNEINNVR